MKEPTRISAVWQEDWGSLFINLIALLAIVLIMVAVIATARKGICQT
jgi:hypothetical protein